MHNEHDDRNPGTVPELRARVAELEQEAIEDDLVRARLAQLLTATANVLNGPPGPLQSHSWHDLPERARGAVRQSGTEAIRAAAAPLELWWAMLQAENELVGEPLADAAPVLSFMGSGCSTLVTAGQLRALFAAIYPISEP